MTLPRMIESEAPENPAALPSLRPTERQLLYARRIAATAGIVLPWEAQQDRMTLSEWISANKHHLQSNQPMSDTPSSRQVGYAERIARARQRSIPDECYRSRSLLSRWIETNRW